MRSFLVFVITFCLLGSGVSLPDDAKDNPMNLDSSSTDRNGFPSNPAWHYQLVTKQIPDGRALCGLTVTDSDHPETTVSFGNPPCSNQTSAKQIDYPWGWHDFVCSTLGGFGENDGILHGHANWFPVHYGGRVFWEAFEHWPMDGDYNLSLQTASDFGQTAGNEKVLGNKRIELEFASAEVNKRFQSPWWKLFRARNDSDRSKMVSGDDGKGNDAFVWGLMGLDSEHFAHSELHPVYAIAIHDRSSTDNDDIWHVWVRNWGDEGFCSQFSHDLDQLPTLTIAIPAPAGAVGKVLNSTNLYSYPAQLAWSAAQNADSVSVAFNLGPAAQRHMFDGDLHIQWQKPGDGHSMLLFVMPQQMTNVASKPRPEDPAAKSVDDWLAKLPKQRKQQLIAARPLEKLLQGGRAKRKPAPGGHFSAEFVLPFKPQAPPVVTLRPDHAKERRDRQRAIAICRAQKGLSDKLLPEAKCAAFLQSVTNMKK